MFAAFNHNIELHKKEKKLKNIFNIKLHFMLKI